VKEILAFWLPLAATWLMMALEGPYITAIVARMPEAAFNLAAYGIAFSIAWIVEAPIMMVLTASNALVRCRQSLHALRRFTYALNAALTAVIAVIAAPPVFRALSALMNLPPEIERLARLATATLLPWPAAIGYRRFYQGLLVRAGLTRRVAYGTLVRLATMSVMAGALALWAPLPGAVIGAISLSAGVVAEAGASRRMARGIVRRMEATPTPPGRAPLTRDAILAFYVPLALTSVLSLITLPLMTFFMSHSRRPIESLAVLPVVNAFVFLFRSGAFAHQEIVVALTGRNAEREAQVRRLTWWLGAAASGGLALVALTPLGDVWFESVSGLSPGIAALAIATVRVLLLLPGLEYLLAYQRGRLIVDHRTRAVTGGTAIEALGIAAALWIGVAALDLVGAIAAAVAMMAGRAGANSFLAWQQRAAAPAHR
jgi:progressive ankylosis protein